MDWKERFWSKVEKTETCWLWRGSIASNGYPRFWLDGQNRPAHRISYEMENGPIPEGKQLDHVREVCEYRHCIRPDHLEPVTGGENLLRSPHTQASKNKAKTHCPRGHPLFGDNLWVHKGTRYCRECRRVQRLASYHRRKS